MDQTTIDLLISNQETIHADTKDLQAKIDAAQEKTDRKLGKVQEDVSKIAGCIVGQDRCVQNMEKLTARIEDVTLVCQRNVTVIETLTKKVDDHGPRIQCLETQKIIVDYKKGLAEAGLKTLTSSPALAFLTFLLGSLVVAAYSPYIGDLIARFGLPLAIATLAAIAVFLYLIWRGRRKMAQAVEYGKVRGLFTV
jgi:hypothetical protein